MLPIKKNLRYFLQLFLTCYCDRCHAKLKLGEEFFCRHCGDYLLSFLHLEEIYRDDFKELWLHLYSCFDFNKVRETWSLLTDIKFENKSFYLDFLLENILFKFPLKIDCITYVPISFRRYVERGFNPAKVIARKIAKDLNVPCKKLLRKKDTRKQSSKSGKDRLKILSNNPFIAVSKKNIFLEGKTLMLIDDIIVTGSTLSIASTTLKQKYGCFLVGGSLFYT